VVNSGFDGALYMLGACGEMGTEIACNDDSPNTSRSQVEAALDPGTYFVVVDGYGTASGEYEVTATVSEMASLEQVCRQAATLTAGRPVTGSTSGQPSYFTATCAGGPALAGSRHHRRASRSRMRVRMRQLRRRDLQRQCQNRNNGKLQRRSRDTQRDDRRDRRSRRHFIYADPAGTGILAARGPRR
jgi:hypothetical protein